MPYFTAWSMSFLKKKKKKKTFKVTDSDSEKYLKNAGYSAELLF